MLLNGSDKIRWVQCRNATLSTKGQSVTLVYVDSTQGWLTQWIQQVMLEVAMFLSVVKSNRWNSLRSGDHCLHKIIKFILSTGPGTFCSFSNISPAAAENNAVELYLVGAGGSRWRLDVVLEEVELVDIEKEESVPIDNYAHASPLVADYPGPN